MVCKNCQTENPENAVFCMKCGKRIDGNTVCPACGALCPEEADFCLQCGKKFAAEEDGGIAQEPATAPKEKKIVTAKVRSAFDLSGGIVLMAGVLFALVFTLCMGITSTAQIYSSYQSTSVSETSMLWEYFGSVYEDLADALNGMESYTGYFEAAQYIPVVLTTVVCAGTLVCVLVFTILSAVKYGKHFKNPELDYAKPAVAAILSFVLGAVAFMTINSATANMSASVKITVSFSDATLAGIILCGIALGIWFGFKSALLGKEFLKKQTIAGFVCTLCGIVLAVLVASFANANAVNLGLKEGMQTANIGLNFFTSNILIASQFKTGAPDFDATYICSVLAQFAQFALLVLAFVLLIQRIGSAEKQKNSRLALSIALFSLAVVALVLSCVAIHFGNELIGNVPDIKPSIAAGPIVALVFSALALADSITHKVLAKKLTE